MCLLQQPVWLQECKENDRKQPEGEAMKEKGRENRAEEKTNGIAEKAGMQEQMRQTGKELLLLLRCALDGMAAEISWDGEEWKRIWQLAKRSNVEAALWPAVKPHEEALPETLRSLWKQAGTMGMYRELQFDVEREQILEALEAHGISYLPLKGILLKDDYPKPGMRYMCDNDILYGYVEPDPAGGYCLRGKTEADKEQGLLEAQKILCTIMKQHGYEVEGLTGNHDAFQKQPIFNFEMHRTLFDRTSPFLSYYKNPWKRAVRREENPHRYEYSVEDQYLFITAHAWKHYDGGGCGIRTLADEAVYLQRQGGFMDWNYVEAEAEKLGLGEFEKALRRCAKHLLLETGEAETEDWEMAYYMLGCGTYGTMDNRIMRTISRLQMETGGDQKQAKKRYARNRIFLSEEQLQEYHPFFYHHKSLRWILPIYRTVRGMFRHPGQLLREWKIWRQYRD